MLMILMSRVEKDNFPLQTFVYLLINTQCWSTDDWCCRFLFSSCFIFKLKFFFSFHTQLFDMFWSLRILLLVFPSKACFAQKRNRRKLKSIKCLCGTSATFMMEKFGAKTHFIRNYWIIILNELKYSNSLELWLVFFLFVRGARNDLILLILIALALWPVVSHCQACDHRHFVYAWIISMRCVRFIAV